MILLCCHSFPADYPSNTQCQAFFKEFLYYGYKSHYDSVVTKFPYADGTRGIQPCTVGIVDGQCKVILMCAIVCFWKEILSPEEIEGDETLKRTLASFRAIRCSYEHHENPSHYFLQSLSDLAAKLQVCLNLTTV